MDVNQRGEVVTVKSDLAKRLLPDGQSSNIDIGALASKVKWACQQGAESLVALKKATDSSAWTQPFKAKQINAGVVSSLESIQLLGTAQIALQAVTADLNQQVLFEQEEIRRHTEKISASQEKQVALSNDHERLVVSLRTNFDLIKSLSSEVGEIHERLESIDSKELRTRLDGFSNRLIGIEKALDLAVQRASEKYKALQNSFEDKHAESQVAIGLLRGVIAEQKLLVVQNLKDIESRVSGQVASARAELESYVSDTWIRTDERLKESDEDHAKKLEFWLNESQVAIQQAIATSHDYSNDRYDASLLEIAKQKRVLEERLYAEKTAMTKELVAAIATAEEHALKTAEKIRRLLFGIGLLAVSQAALIGYVIIH
jgi:Holliday junction resolvasome RuvABC endonuclease subunit